MILCSHHCAPKNKRTGTKFRFWVYVKGLGFKDEMRELLDTMKLKEFVVIGVVYWQEIDKEGKNFGGTVILWSL